MSSNHKLCHLVSTCHFNSVIQSLNTVIVLLFCYLPVFYYLPVFCYFAIPLVTGPVLVLVGIWYWLLLYLTGIPFKSNYWYDACMCIASMPFVFSCSPKVLCYRNVAIIMHLCLLSFFLCSPRRVLCSTICANNRYTAVRTH